MSADLIWLLVKDNNSYLVKRNGVQWSREPGNLRNVNAFKYSGLAKAKSIGVIPAADKKGVTIVTQKGKSLAQPAKRYAKTTVHSGTRRVAKTINGLAKNHYRADLKKAALARVAAIIASQKPNKKAVKTGRQ